MSKLLIGDTEVNIANIVSIENVDMVKYHSRGDGFIDGAYYDRMLYREYEHTKKTEILSGVMLENGERILSNKNAAQLLEQIKQKDEQLAKNFVLFDKLGINPHVQNIQKNGLLVQKSFVKEVEPLKLHHSTTQHFLSDESRYIHTIKKNGYAHYQHEYYVPLNSREIEAIILMKNYDSHFVALAKFECDKLLSI